MGRRPRILSGRLCAGLRHLSKPDIAAYGGSDELRYADNGRLLDTLNIQWDAYDDTVYIDYGRVDLPRELRRVHIRRGMLTADLYIGGRYYDRITLYMQ
jgi:hypothetical protein